MMKSLTLLGLALTLTAVAQETEADKKCEKAFFARKHEIRSDIKRKLMRKLRFRKFLRKFRYKPSSLIFSFDFRPELYDFEDFFKITGELKNGTKFRSDKGGMMHTYIDAHPQSTTDQVTQKYLAGANHCKGYASASLRIVNVENKKSRLL